jgi:SAM-dependent methyltransferase
MTTYSLGSDDAELARLEEQAEFIREPTRLLLEASGLEPGMRVLDLGTGMGHVATAVADLVGPKGRVVGLDRDPRMLEVARARTHGRTNVQIVEGDVTGWRGAGPFDAVVGRLILFHLPDPVGVLRHHLEAVRAGGRVVLLDYDLGGLRTEPHVPFAEQVTALVIAAFRAAGADPTIGARLRDVLADAGVSDIGARAVSRYVSADDPVGPAMLSDVVRSLAPVIVQHGLATEAELDLDTLPGRIADSLRSAGAVLVPPVLAGAWGRR